MIPKLFTLFDGPFETKVNYVNASKPGFSAEVELLHYFEKNVGKNATTLSRIL